jgi:hypothetical protein
MNGFCNGILGIFVLAAVVTFAIKVLDWLTDPMPKPAPASGPQHARIANQVEHDLGGNHRATNHDEMHQVGITYTREESGAIAVDAEHMRYNMDGYTLLQQGDPSTGPYDVMADANGCWDVPNVGRFAPEYFNQYRE